MTIGKAPGQTPVEPRAPLNFRWMKVLSVVIKESEGLTKKLPLATAERESELLAYLGLWMGEDANRDKYATHTIDTLPYISNPNA